MTSTTVHHRVEEIAPDYQRLVPRPTLHESVPWLRYCDRRSKGNMRYVAARGAHGELTGLTALRHTADESTASPNYDVLHLARHFADPAAAPGRCYPQLFAAVSGTRCLLVADGPEVRRELVRAAAALADAEGAVLAFAYLSDEDTTRDVARTLGRDRYALVGAEARLDAEWADFDGYVASRPKRSRNKIRRERRQYRAGGLRTRVLPTAAALDERVAALQVGLSGKYGTPASVETVLTDYADLAATVGEHVLLFQAERAGRPVGMCLCLRDESTLHIRNVGFDYSELGDDFVYFNLMCYEPLAWGLANGVTSFRFGNGAYEAKYRRGCRLEPLFGVLRRPGPPLAPSRPESVAREEIIRASSGELEELSVHM